MTKPKKGPKKADAADAARQREIQGYRNTARDLVNELPLSAVIEEVKAIGKGRFAGTSFQREAIIFRFVREFNQLHREYIELFNQLEERKSSEEADVRLHGDHAHAQ